MTMEIQKLLDRELKRLYEDLNRLTKTLASKYPGRNDRPHYDYRMDTTIRFSKLDLRKYCKNKGDRIE
ncbi:MAG: hypothetical protein GOP50_00885 [Candidatus Heimdallarchaeota archaeon]|nr:hypothetical protein [Candidatus Heimdallarchaeota archaeon]